MRSIFQVMTNSTPTHLKIILPVLFTFGATLAFSQTAARADTTPPSGQPAAQQVAQVQPQAQSQPQGQQRLTVVNAATTVAPQQSQQGLPQVPGAVSLNDGSVKAAANAPVIDTKPGYTTGQYQVSAQAVNPSTGAGGVQLNLSGLSSSQQQFVNSLHDGAIQSWHDHGVLPSVTAAQAIIESGWGQSTLSTQAHNLFGIKGSYNGHSVNMMTREVVNGRSVYVNAAFRAYANNSESVADHGAFLATNSRYRNLLWQTDYHTVTYLIRADGYATDPNYTATLNAVIQRYGLNAWDAEAMDVNDGHLDDLSVRGNQLHISGWHATKDYNGSMHHFIIVRDANTQRELYRTEVPGFYRQDVQNVYPNLAISGWGGFDLTIPYSSAFANTNLQVVSRYTYNTNGEPNGGRDIYFSPVATNANLGSLDQMSIDANTGAINIAGWHASDASIDKNYHFIIIYDASKHIELGRYRVNDITRNDVARVYNVYNAAQSGFSLKLNFNPALAGDQIQVISRYSDQQNGEGNRVDYWFAPKAFTANDAYLDQMSIDANTGQLNISGWHAADQSIGKNYHYVIIYDATQHTELGRYLVNNLGRGDVARAYPDIYNAGKSGFNLKVDFTPAMAGDQIQVISRYSDNKYGEGNYVDYWFAPKSFTQNEAYLDNYTVKGNQLHVSGWNANDESAGRPYHYLILFDATTGREVKRQLVNTTARADVAKAMPDVYNAGKCGFDWSTSLDSSLNGHRLQVISRYSDSKSGEGNYTDFWFSPITTNIH